MPFPNNSLAHTGCELAAAAQGTWHLVTRLGEAQILLPAMAAALLWLLISARDMSTARRWLLFTALAAALTTATKVAFIGYELGYAPLDYTGISGHAMFAAAILPVLTGIAAAGTAPRWRAAAIGTGYVLAAVVAYSRWRVGAHSPVEAIAGLALGSLASATVLYAGKLPHSRPPLWLGVGLVLWMSSLPLSAPASMTHDWVIRLSLAVSDRSAPYQRAQMHRDYLRDPRRRQAAKSLAQPSSAVR